MVKARDPLKTFLYPLNFTTWNTTHPALNSTSIVKTMLTRLFLRPNSVILSPTHFFLFPKLSLTKPTIASNALPYGPSLRKGKTSLNCPQQKQRRRQQQQEYQSLSGPKPLYQCKEDQEGEKEEEPDDVNVINEDDFTRVFDIAALRVPAKDCFSLESRIRGHLLNWPRIRNIARVPGDEMEESMVSLLGEKGSEDEENFDAFNRRIYGKAEGDGEELSPVLFREKLANEFNSRGFIKFRNLAKISRPKRKKKKKMGGKGEEGEENERERRDGFSVVEVVEEEEGGDWKGLLGDEFKGRGKWMGSTRLLLLDERYAEKGVDELPQAIKAVAQEAMRGNSTSTFNLVRCKLTLFYDYWQMNEILEALLPRDMIIPSAFETVGHIAHLNLRDEHLPYKKLIAKVVLDKNKPKIQTVVNKIDAIHNDYRTMQLEVLAGNHSLVTMVVENGLRFHVDLAAVYWNSRLASERQRLLNGFTRNDVLCDVFAGVGPIALSAAKIVKHVYANDLNPCAVQYMEKNSVLNKLERHIEIFNMDGRRFIDAMYASQKAQSITQVVMNLPNDAVEYLGVQSFPGPNI
ncbi:tRNA (guanine(37)-N1)-methyltransferase 1 [Populus alba x Populus x berolinensis]|uniref:tRNA (guanine(37)-N1)-methyltransferase n=1 Tax=Populus alba x Populus x berolinensis TaxID=444605 RepID=A0AAD6M6T7_9ROSI|nr:tRNA (guanine(37)-N1)-methyltransferase 1 [Populus alba x Populus x berolinensis]